MPRNKVRRYETAKQLPNIYGVTAAPRGGWAARVFGNDHPVVVEAGCGRGEYSLALGRRFPAKNFVGVDVKLLRLAQGARRALDEGLRNVAFLYGNVRKLPDFFLPGEVCEIWLPFPDPQPDNESHRLMSPGFLSVYEHILGHEGALHLKTDNEILFRYAYRLLRQSPCWKMEAVVPDIQRLPAAHPARLTTTHYEQKFASAGISIFYLKARCHRAVGKPR